MYIYKIKSTFECMANHIWLCTGFFSGGMQEFCQWS